MKVSIIVPVYNNDKLIGRCLQSLINQSYQKIEIIAVNDGSTDFTLKKLLDLKELDSRIKIIDQANNGTHIARLKGIENSTGDAILHMDSDDYLELDAVALYVDRMVSENADIVLANHYVHSRNKKKIVVNKIPIENDQLQILKYFLLGRIKGYIWGKLFRRSLLENIIIPTKERVITEDVLTNLYVFCNFKIKLSLIDKALYNYTEDDSVISFSKDRKNIAGFFDEINLLEKMLSDHGYKEHLRQEIATYKCRTWVIYCRAQGPNSLNKEFHVKFYNENYNLAKKGLPVYQRIEMKAYVRSITLGRFTTASMKWVRNLLFR